MPAAVTGTSTAGAGAAASSRNRPVPVDPAESATGRQEGDVLAEILTLSLLRHVNSLAPVPVLPVRPPTALIPAQAPPALAGAPRDAAPLSSRPHAAERASGDLALVTALAGALADAATVGEVVDVVRRGLPPVAGARALHLLLRRPDGSSELVTGGGDVDLRAGGPAVVGAPSVAAVLAEVLRSGRPLVQARPGEGRDCWAFLPLLAEGRPVGACALDLGDGGVVPRDRLPLLEALGGLCARALVRTGRHDGERDAGLALQRALAPAALPDVPGMTLESRYAPAETGQAGGDFFEVLPLPNGRLAVSFGDVAGHGPSVAAVMSTVQATLRAYAFEGHAAADVVSRTNRVLMSQPEPPFVTCCCAELDPASGRLCIAMAGHLPPLLLRADGTTEFLSLPTGLPLGVVPGPDFVATEVPLRPGDAVLLYTDGLVESREIALTDGMDVLLATAQASSTADPRALVEHLLDSVRPAGSTDDVALLLVRYDGTP